MKLIEWLSQPWPWYVGGPLIGLMVPVLLILGNKTFGISSSLRHICAACIPAKIPFFQYEWKRELWNLFLVTGVLLGGVVVALFLHDPSPIKVNPHLAAELQQHGITNFEGTVPMQLFSWQNLLTARGLIMTIGGGFLVGFGTRYAGGCTSGHSIMGLANLHMPSLIATVSFMAGGFFVANLILPWILKL